MWQPGVGGDESGDPPPPQPVGGYGLPGSGGGYGQPGGDYGQPGGDYGQPGGYPPEDGGYPPGRLRRSGRSGRRMAAFAAIGVIGLAGLGICAVGVAKQVLPRHFSATQRREITNWEMERRWRALAAGGIFPATVSYQLPATLLDSSSGLTLQAQRLGIAGQTACADGVVASAARVLGQHGCVAVLRATYLDSTGSMVATVAVAVLPDSAAAQTALVDLTGATRDVGTPSTTHQVPLLVRPLAVPGTAAAGFGLPQRQLSDAITAGPYLILSTAGFADGRPRVQLSSDDYLDEEMTSLAAALAASAGTTLGSQPPAPSCPGAPGC